MSKIKWPALLALLLVLSLALAACTGPSGTTEVQATEEPAAEEPAVEEPAVEEPAAEEPAAEEPVAEEGDRQIATFIWTQEFDTLSPLYTSCLLYTSRCV